MYSLKSLFAAGCLLLSAASNATTIINVSPNLQQANIGDTVSVNLTISGVNTGAVPALGAYDISLSFDPSLLSFEVATFGSQLDIHGLGDVQTVTPSTGSVEIFEVSLYSANDLTMLQKSSFTLGNIWFQTLAAGTSALTLSVNALADANGNSLVANTENGSINISSVPEPDGVQLIATGLLFFGILRHTRARPTPSLRNI